MPDRRDTQRTAAKGSESLCAARPKVLHSTLKSADPNTSSARYEAFAKTVASLFGVLRVVPLARHRLGLPRLWQRVVSRARRAVRPAGIEEHAHEWDERFRCACGARQGRTAVARARGHS
jgi:hypothetical protein